jgi:hypothetical protein
VEILLAPAPDCADQGDDSGNADQADNSADQADDSGPTPGELDALAVDDAVKIKIEVQAISRTLLALSSLNTPLWGYQAENTNAFRRIRKDLEPVLKAFADAPGAALLLLFAQEGEIRDEDMPTLDVQKKMLSRMRAYLAMSRHLQRRAGQLADSKPGKHGNIGFRQDLAATEAWDSLTRRGRQPAYSGSEESEFHRLASLYYEIMTGEADVNLTRACREVHRRKKLRPQKSRKKISK